ncbi:MAG: hypothetical protein ACI8VI_001002, partial [Granulosicoccus sp.]
MNLATLIQPQIKQQIESLYQDFLTLNESERSILMVLAVVYKPIGIAKLGQLTDLLTNRGFLPGTKKAFRLSAEQKDRLNELSLISANKDGVQLNRLLANRLAGEINQLHTSFTCTAHEKLLEIMMAAEEMSPVVNTQSWQK